MKGHIVGCELLSVVIFLFGIVTLLGAILLLRRRHDRLTGLLLSQVILLPLFELVIILAAHIDFHPRYFLLGVVPILMMVAAGLAGDAPLSPNPFPPRKRGERGAGEQLSTGSPSPAFWERGAGGEVNPLHRLRPALILLTAALSLAVAFQMTRVV